MANKEHLEMLQKNILGWNDWRERHNEIRPDLEGANLTGAFLNGADLSNAYLSKANLSEASLVRINLYGADLEGTNLTKANLTLAGLSGAYLKDAIFREAKMNRAAVYASDLGGADLSDADLSDANLSGTNLIGANLKGAKLKSNLTKAKLTGVDLKECNLRGALLKQVNLREADLSGADLRQTNFAGAELSKVKLRGANLFEADLSETNLKDADLRGANLRRANLNGASLSGAIFDERTSLYQIKGVQTGVNGIYSESSDSAALMILVPRGNSMQGSNPDVVVESLRRARRLHGYSLTLAGFAILIAMLNLHTLEFPSVKGLEVTPDIFVLLAMPISIAVLIVVNSFFNSALNGTRHLQDRDSAMKVGNFPWSLSRYSGESITIKILSYITRSIMTFHPVVYIYFLERWNGLQLFGYAFIMVILLILSFWTFAISQRFQKPILFDAKQEKERKTDIEKLTMAVDNQTDELRNLIDLIKPKKTNSTKITKQTKGKPNA